MDRILVATDFSPRSDRALRRATLIAKQTGATLTLAHVVDADQPQRLVAVDRAEASSLLGETVQTLRTIDGVSAEPLIEVDDVYSGILQAAERVAADLIVVGPHRGRLADIFTGTTVERVVRRTRRPLLVAAQPPTAPYTRTMLALDFDEASKAAGRTALAMGIFDQMPVVVMHAFEGLAERMLRRGDPEPGVLKAYRASEREDATDKLHALVEEIGLPPSPRRIVSVNGTPARSILETALQEGADLIVVGTNQREGFERLLIGSVTSDVIRDAHRDVLIIPVDSA